MDINNSFNICPNLETKQEMNQFFVEQSVSALQEICRDYFDRMQNCNTNLSLLNKGVFYGGDYYLKLKQLGQQERLEFLKNKGSFYHGYIAGKTFQQIVNPNSITGYDFNRYKIQADKTASQAVNVLFGKEGIVLTGCGEVCEFAQNKALLQVLGEKKFNYLFSAESNTPLMTGINFKTHLSSLLQAFPLCEMQPGDQVYFHNTLLYSNKHINGEARGYNTLYKGQGEIQKFLGLGLNPEGATKEEIIQSLLKEYNTRPIGMEYLSTLHAQRMEKDYHPAEMNLIKKYENSKLDLVKFMELGGGKIEPKGIRMHFDRIWTLHQADLSEGRNLMKEWTEES